MAKKNNTAPSLEEVKELTEEVKLDKFELSEDFFNACKEIAVNVVKNIEENVKDRKGKGKFAEAFGLFNEEFAKLPMVKQFADEATEYFLNQVPALINETVAELFPKKK